MGAKRSRCESKPMNDPEEAVNYQDMMTVVNTAVCNIFILYLSIFHLISRMYSFCVLFFHYQESSPIATESTNTPSSNISSSMLSDHTTDQTCVSFTYYCPDKYQELPPKCQQLIDKNLQKNKSIEPALVHTISTYRKQQKQLRINGKPTNKACIFIIIHNCMFKIAR